MKKTLISLALHDIFNADGHQFATGAILDPESSDLFSLHAWVIYTPDPEATPRKGRKRNLAKKAGLLLAHRWHCGFKNMKCEEADEALVSMFGYSDSRAVRRVRQQAVREINKRYEFHVATEAENRYLSQFFEETATLRFSDTDFEISGPGWLWFFGEREAEYGHWRLKAEGDRPAVHFVQRVLGGQK
ncbi:MAG TPA: hypothetical protein PK880_05790 [Candidatus Competibacter sp.]|nr:hypothetical protein [Candidatus Competibacteraceae bacterium]HRC72029.1 hypothetical protein [Candidatus Competibacter sp.]